MRYTVYNMLVDIKRKIHGGSIPSDFQSCLDEGVRIMRTKIMPPEMERTGYIEQALYDQVEKYAVAEDVKYDNIIDIKMLDKYRNLDTIATPLGHLYRRQFDQKRRENVFSINYSNGVKAMSIYRPKGLHKYRHLLINEVNSLTKNGTWNIGGNVVNLRLDELNHVTKKASLSFDINNSSTTGFIENFTMTPVDINDYMNIGAAFSWLNLPIPQNMIAIKLSLGSNQTDITTDLFYSTVNQPHDNNQFTTYWNLLKYMLNNVNSIGNPNPKSIGYIRWDFTTNGKAIANCNLDSLVVRKGYVYEMVYNSSWCLIDALTQAWKQWTTRNSDQFPFEGDTYQCAMLETALVIQQDLYANNLGAQSDVTGIETELQKAYLLYQKNHKAEFISPEQYTNTMGRQVYGRGTYVVRDHHSRPKNWFEEGGEGWGGGGGGDGCD